MAVNKTRQEIFQERSAQAQEALHTHLRELKLLGIEPGKETYLHQVQQTGKDSTTQISNKTTVQTDLQIINTAQATESGVGAVSGIVPPPNGIKPPPPTSLSGIMGGVVESTSTNVTIGVKFAHEGYHAVLTTLDKELQANGYC